MQELLLGTPRFGTKEHCHNPRAKNYHRGEPEIPMPRVCPLREHADDSLQDEEAEAGQRQGKHHRSLTVLIHGCPPYSCWFPGCVQVSQVTSFAPSIPAKDLLRHSHGRDGCSVQCFVGASAALYFIDANSTTYDDFRRMAPAPSCLYQRTQG